MAPIVRRRKAYHTTHLTDHATMPEITGDELMESLIEADHGHYSVVRRPPSSSAIWRLIILGALFLLLFESYVLIASDRSTRQPTRRPPPLRAAKFKAPELHTFNDTQTLAMIERQSNLPALYWDQWNKHNKDWKTFQLTGVEYCHGVKLTPIHALRQANGVWQVLDLSHLAKNRTEPFLLYIFRAYFDDRSGRPEVKILTSCSEQEAIEKMSLGCLLWFDNQRFPVASTVTEIYSIWPEYWDFGFKPGIFGPQIITCSIPLPYRKRTPRAVSLVARVPGDPMCGRKRSPPPDNVVRVDRNVDRFDLQPARKNIGVCVHAFRFATYDFSVRLVEWLELVRLMGAAKVYFYVYDATEGIYRILDHYTREGLVDWRRLTFPGWQPNVQSMYEYVYKQIGGLFWPQELIDVNDCLYRNLYRHDYIAEFDVDEMIVPQDGLNDWSAVIESLEVRMSAFELKTTAYYLSHHAYVYEKWPEERDADGRVIPEHLYMMRHTYRAEPYPDDTNAKCFHRTNLVTALHSHLPMRCFSDTPTDRQHHNCVGLGLHPDRQSLVMHFRSNREPNVTCTQNQTTIEVRDRCTVHDRHLWQWLGPVRQRVQAKLAEIFPSCN